MEIWIVLTLAASLSGNVYQFFQNQDLEDEIAQIIEKGKIRINVQDIRETQKNISLEIPTTGNYFIDTNEVDALRTLFDREQAHYSWEYTFNLGYDYPNSWNWCPQINEKTGEVVLYVPKVSELAINSPDVDVDVINGSWFDSLREETTEYAHDIIDERINEHRTTLLETDSIIKNTNTAYARHLKELLNSSHHGHNPIKTVKLVNVENSPASCINLLAGDGQAPL